MTTSPLVELHGVAKRYGDVTVLDGLDLTVAAGESVAVVGPSGSGKSTLLHLIGGLDAPSAGSVRVGGRAIGGLREAELAAFRRREVGFVFQGHHLLPQCTALENVLVPALVDGGARAHEVRARALLERVGLGGRADHLPAQLSGGERQRVAVVRALLLRPPLLLADEPTGSLDARSAEALGELLAALNATDGVTLIVVTHADKLARRMGRVLALEGGRLQAAARG